MKEAKRDWLIPTGLVALGVVPVIAGAVRLLELGGAVAQVSPEDARFFAAPLPVVLHIISVTIYVFLGAFQFQPSLRRKRPRWHRVAGRILVLCGLVAALSGLWMSQIYPPATYDGPILRAERLVVGSAMVLFICLGLDAIRRREIPKHSAWMIRSYALGLGAGTQVVTHLPWILFPAIRGELTRALFMGAGWAINVAVAEWIIRRSSRRAEPVARQRWATSQTSVS